MSTPNVQSWVEAQLANLTVRDVYVRELVRMHQEAIDRKNPELARWCMRARAQVDSSDSTRYSREVK